MSNKSTYHSKLSLKLLMITILAIGVGVAVFLGLQHLSEHILDRFFITSTYLQDKSGVIATEFQSYVAEQKLSTTDIEKIAKWVKDKKVVLLDIYLDNHVLYSSSMLDVADMETDSEITFQVWEQVYDIQFKDELAQIKVTGLFDYQIYNYAKMTNLLLAFLAAMITAIIPIKKRINYIDGMEAEVQILEGGDLNYSMTVRGNDELTYLASSIDKMRKSFVFRLNSEEEIRQANRELITAMSHDLRTPLTTQIGYLEIMKNKVCTEKEKQEYLEKCMKKAYQIKNLSDKLFEYFLAFHVEEEEELLLQSYEGNEVLIQLLHEKVFLLEEQGAQVKIIWREEKFFLAVDMEILCRVFDNIFSNISKYADKKRRITITLILKKEEIALTFENYKVETIEKVESTKIGLRNIERMMKKLKGTCSVEQEGDIFSLKLILPRKIEGKSEIKN